MFTLGEASGDIERLSSCCPWLLNFKQSELFNGDNLPSELADLDKKASDEGAMILTAKLPLRTGSAETTEGPQTEEEVIQERKAGKAANQKELEDKLESLKTMGAKLTSDHSLQDTGASRPRRWLGLTIN